MDIKSKLKLILVAPVLLLAGFQCSNDSKLLEDIPETTYIDDCPDRIFEFGDMISVGDPNLRFMINLPYSWDIRESFSDSLYGVFASNFLSIPKPLEDQMAISITGYNSSKEIDQYYHDELIALVKAENAKVLERGNSMFAGQKNPWVMFELEEGIFNMVYYMAAPQANEIYLIQTVTYDTVYQKSKMCYLKQLVNSFEWVNE